MCQYDLTILGVMGIGRVRDSQIGSVCERVTRTINKDILVVKQLPEADDQPVRDTILVGVGAHQPFEIDGKPSRILCVGSDRVDVGRLQKPLGGAVPAIIVRNVPAGLTSLVAGMSVQRH